MDLQSIEEISYWRSTVIGDGVSVHRMLSIVPESTIELTVHGVQFQLESASLPKKETRDGPGRSGENPISYRDASRVGAFCASAKDPEQQKGTPHAKVDEVSEPHRDICHRNFEFGARLS